MDCGDFSFWDDPACGSGGFLLNTILHWKAQHTDDDVLKLEWDGTPHDVRPVWPKGVQLDLNSCFHGYDNDRTMVRIAWMNLILHDLEFPSITQLDSLSKRLKDEASATYDHVLAKGKTDKQQLTLPEPTKQALNDWMQIRGGESGALFPNLDRAKKGRRLTGVSIYRIVRALGEENGIKTRPHGIRHTAITEACKVAAENGIGLEEVLDFSRHSRSSVAILMVYRDRERNIQGQMAKYKLNRQQKDQFCTFVTSKKCNPPFVIPS